MRYLSIFTGISFLFASALYALNKYNPSESMIILVFVYVGIDLIMKGIETNK